MKKRARKKKSGEVGRNRLRSGACDSMSTNYHSLVRRLSGMGATDEEAARKKAASSDKALATAASKQGRAQKKADAALAVFVDAKKSVAEARTAHTEQATLLQVVIHNPPLLYRPLRTAALP